MPNVKELQDKAKHLRKLLRQVEGLPGVGKGEHLRDAARKQATRAVGRLVVVPRCKDKERRERLEADDIAWLMHYFGPESGSESPFTYTFTSQQQEMITAIRAAIMGGDDQALAASRGEGKTTIAERLLLKYTLQGRIKFSVLFAATGSAAEDSLASIKAEIESNNALYADYPEVCEPVRALEGIAQKANSQLVQGDRHDDLSPYESHPSRFSWCGQEIYFPTVPGSPSSGAIIATRGLDSAVRGLKKKGRRVDVAVIDDPDTEDTSRSEDQARKLEKRIDRAIGGLGAQSRPVSRVMLTTLQSRISVSYRYTDPHAKPSWKGRRFRFLVSPPDTPSLWDEYISLQKEDWVRESTDAKDFYIANRAAMDAGAVVANPNRFTSGEISALQHYYNLVARLGPEAVATEYDNDPPEEGLVEAGLTERMIQKQVNGHAHRVIPPGCVLITHNVDPGKQKGFNWVVRAWEPNGTGHTIDYGTMSVHGVKHGSDEGLERALFNAVLRRMDEFRSARYAFANGDVLDKTISTFDCRWQTDAILSGVAKAGLGVHGIMGIGKGGGCVPGQFHDVIENTAKRRKCGTNGAYEELHVGPYGKLWVIHAQADKWKTFEHERWRTARDKPGCMFLWGEPAEGAEKLSPDERSHQLYAESICSEVEVQDGQKRTWIQRGKKNDYFDCSWHSCCAAAIKGVRVLAVKPVTKPAAQRPTLAQMAGRK